MTGSLNQCFSCFISFAEEKKRIHWNWFIRIDLVPCALFVPFPLEEILNNYMTLQWNWVKESCLVDWAFSAAQVSCRMSQALIYWLKNSKRSEFLALLGLLQPLLDESVDTQMRTALANKGHSSKGQNQNSRH